MRKLIATKNLATMEWLSYRRKGVCGSDASIVLGINQYTSVLQLWEDKTNRIPIEEKESDYTYFGHIMEPVIKQEFTKRTGLKVRAKNYILQSDKYPWMLADVDGLIKEKDGTYSVFEAKTANEYKKELWKKKVPDEYYAQVQHYLCVTGFSKAYVCAVVGGNSYYCHEVMRDEEYIRMLVKKEWEFWQCVQNDIVPEVDGAKATSQYINEHYSQSLSREILLPDEANNLVASYFEVDEALKEMSQKKTEIVNRLKMLMKENERGYIGEHVIHWPTVKKRSVDMNKLKDALGERYEEYLAETSYRKFSVA